jgi:hypothetical protein
MSTPSMRRERDSDLRRLTRFTTVPASQQNGAAGIVWVPALYVVGNGIDFRCDGRWFFRISAANPSPIRGTSSSRSVDEHTTAHLQSVPFWHVLAGCKGCEHELWPTTLAQREPVGGGIFHRSQHRYSQNKSFQRSRDPKALRSEAEMSEAEPCSLKSRYRRYLDDGESQSV